MKAIRFLMLLAVLTGLAGVIAVGVALSMAASDETALVVVLWIAAAVCVSIAIAATVGVRALNARHGTEYTLFTV
ncbi:MAG: hypothetical protein QM809_06730 [Gordonia sp. (in: high G+C Gram-positive bacteria)]|uniref:hypothetical protein n=1 Tax=Gordonia sp. (in: high G+C Gram-positive bacteria) TaxID=84139 RepID=UPI0039E262F7